MQNVSIGEILHEMSKPVIWANHRANQEQCFNIMSAENFTQISNAGSFKLRNELGHSIFLQNCVCAQRRLSSLRIRAIWSESSQGTMWVTKDQKRLQADSEDSDRTAQMYRLIWVFIGRKCNPVGMVCPGSNKDTKKSCFKILYLLHVTWLYCVQ